jgi:hypothetical protein
MYIIAMISFVVEVRIVNFRTRQLKGIDPQTIRGKCTPSQMSVVVAIDLERILRNE